MHRTSRFILVLALGFVLAGPASARGLFHAHLSDEENVPAFTSPTDAEGRFFLRRALLGELRYSLVLSNLRNAFAAHIHCGEVGVAGPIGVTLFQFTNPATAAVTLNGTIAEGPILAPDPDNACGWADLDDVVDALESGDTYVNVHTLQSLAGEIRGQIR